MKRFLEQEKEREGRKTKLEMNQNEKQAKVLRQFFREEHMEQELYEQDDHATLSSIEVEEHLPKQDVFLEISHVLIAKPEEDMKDDGTPMSWKEEPKFFVWWLSFSRYRYQVMIIVHGCGFNQGHPKQENSTYETIKTNVVINQTRIILIPAWASPLTASAYYPLKKFHLKPNKATNAFHQL